MSVSALVSVLIQCSSGQESNRSMSSLYVTSLLEQEPTCITVEPSSSEKICQKDWRHNSSWTAKLQMLSTPHAQTLPCCDVFKKTELVTCTVGFTSCLLHCSQWDLNLLSQRHTVLTHSVPWVIYFLKNMILSTAQWICLQTVMSPSQVSFIFKSLTLRPLAWGA